MEGDNSDSSDDIKVEIKHIESDEERKVLRGDDGKRNRAVRRTFQVTDYDTSDGEDTSEDDSTAVDTLRISRSARGIRVDRDTSNISDRIVSFRRRPLTRRRLMNDTSINTSARVQPQPPMLERIITPLIPPTSSSSSEQAAILLAQPAALAQFASVAVSTDSANLPSRFNIPPTPYISNQDIIQQNMTTTTRSATGFGTYTRFINAFDDLFPSDRYSSSSEEKNIIPCPIPNGSDVEAKPSLFVCQICQLNQISTVTFPCMHCCMCDTCAYEFSKIGNTCPMCRLGIVQIGKIYLSSKQADELEPQPGKLKLNPSNSSSSTDV